MGRIELSEMHQRAVNRRRRVIIHFDTTKIISEGGMAPLNFDNPIENYCKRLFDFIDNVPNTIDSIHWDPMFDTGEEYAIYPSKILPLPVSKALKKKVTLCFMT